MSGRHYAPSLAGRPASTTLSKHKLSEVNEDSEEYAASTFGGFTDYNRRKKLKLQNQDALLRSRASDDNLPVFAGMTIHINGYTKPGRVELWNMIVSYGGVYKQYLEGKTDVTHIVASNLTKKKQQEFAKYRIVRPEWIVDSIRAGKALSWHDSRYRVLDAGKDQHTLLLSEGNGFALGSESVSKSYKDVIREKSSRSAQEKTSVDSSEESTRELPSEPLETVTRRAEPAPAVFEPDPGPRSRDDIFRVSVAKQERSEAGITNVLGEAPKAQTLASRQDSRPATKTAKDPDFIQDYFRNSRLHHLSTWKANLRLKIANLSKAMSPPSAAITQRIVMHVDFDCFFAAISARKRPDVKGKPCAVTHGGSNSGEIASCNYEAREFGIKNGMWMKEAVKLCPDIISLPYDFDAYEAASDLFYQTLLDLRATAIEAVSIDEALVNISNLIPQTEDSRETELSALSLATQVRNDIRTKTGVEVSVGIGANVLQSKLALKIAKPSGQAFLRPENLLTTLDSFAVASLPGVGHSTDKRLEEHFQVTTVQELRAISQSRLQEVFGPKTGISLAQASLGIDDTIVGDIAQRKLVSIEINWGIRLDTSEEVSDYMRRVSIELCRKLKDVGFQSAQHLLVKVMRRSKTAPIDPPKFLGHGPCDKFNAGREIPMSGDFNVVWKHSLALLESLHIPPNELRGIGVALTKLQTIADTPDSVQMSMSKYFNAATTSAMILQQKATMDTSSKLLSNRQHVALVDSTQYVIPSQIDAAVLAELPKAIQDKIHSRADTNTKAMEPQDGDIYSIPRASQIDPADLAALPASLRHEILLYSRSNPRSPSKNTINRFVVKTPSPKRKSARGLNATLTQTNFIERPTKQNLTSAFRDVAQAVEISSSPSADIDREVLAVLPEEIRREVILEDRNRRLAQIRKDSKNNAKPSVTTISHDLSGERARKMIDLPREEQINYGELGSESLEALKSYLQTWFEEETEDGPDAGDMDDFRGYLELLILEDRDFERVESLLKWIWSIVTKHCDNFVWVQAVRDLVDSANASMVRAGLGRLKIGN